MKWYERWLAEIQAKRARNEPLDFKDYIKICIDVESHEDETHRKYANIAEREGMTEVAEVFKDLASGEDSFYERLKKMVASP